MRNDNTLLDFIMNHPNDYIYVFSNGIIRILFEGRGNQLFQCIGSIFYRLHVIDYLEVEPGEYDVTIEFKVEVSD